jgi:hypothetical protein
VSLVATGTLPPLLGSDKPPARASQADVPWLDQVQRPPDALPQDAPVLSPLLVDDKGQPITTRAAWEQKRLAIRTWWLDFLGVLPIPRAQPPKLELLAEERVDGVVRQLVRYQTEPDQDVEAYLLKPTGVTGPRPGVVVFHSTVDYSIRQPAGIEGRSREMAFGLTLAQRDYVTFSPRNFLWPENRRIDARGETALFHQRHPRSKGMARMLFDAQVAVDILSGLPEVDARRIGVVGHSLGAKEVLYLAALDERVQVAVSSEGGIGMRFSNWDAAWYLGDEINQAGFQHEHHELLSLVAPRPFLLVGGDSADGARSWPFVEAALPVYRLYSGRARVGLFNHQQGHTVTPDAARRTEEWLDAYL